MNQADKRILDKFIALIADNPHKVILLEENNQRSMDIVIYPNWDESKINVKPKAFGIFVTIKEDLHSVDITLLEKTCVSPQRWPTSDVPFQRVLMKEEDQKMYQKFVSLYDEVEEAHKKIKEDKTAKVVQDIIDGKYSFENPIEKLLNKFKVPTGTDVPGIILQQPDIIGEDIEIVEDEEFDDD